MRKPFKLCIYISHAFELIYVAHFLTVVSFILDALSAVWNRWKKCKHRRRKQQDGLLSVTEKAEHKDASYTPVRWFSRRTVRVCQSQWWAVGTLTRSHSVEDHRHGCWRQQKVTPWCLDALSHPACYKHEPTHSHIRHPWWNTISFHIMCFFVFSPLLPHTPHYHHSFLLR